jgi:hypothetical protein
MYSTQYGLKPTHFKGAITLMNSRTFEMFLTNVCVKICYDYASTVLTYCDRYSHTLYKKN